MRFHRMIVLLLAVTLAATACVSKKKYGEMEALKDRMQDMADSRTESLNQINAEMADLRAKFNDCEETRIRLCSDTARLAEGNRKLRRDFDELKSDNQQLKNSYQMLKSQNSEKMRDLVDQMETLQRDLNAREKEITFIEASLKERGARLSEVENNLLQRDSLMNAIQKSVADALLGFKDQGLSVEVIDGKVYVSLSNKLLFATGSTKIDANGQKALAELANVLKRQKDISILVEGHTDNMPVSNLGDIKDNWDLSVMRSTEVVRILVANGMEPTRTIPAGHGQFVPKVEGNTPEARAANRRTEIVIYPKLDELYKIIDQQH
jgi:chemotaxis protein MotB